MDGMNGVVPTYPVGGSGEWMNNPFIYLIFLALFSGGGLGFGGGQCATQEQVRQVSDTSNLMAGQDNLRNAFATGLRNVEFDLVQLENVSQNGFFGIQKEICDSRYAADRCCCETNRNIDRVGAANTLAICEQTNALTNTIREEGAATRALFNETRMRDLESQLNRVQIVNDITTACGCGCNGCI